MALTGLFFDFSELFGYTSKKPYNFTVIQKIKICKLRSSIKALISYTNLW